VRDALDELEADAIRMLDHHDIAAMQPAGAERDRPVPGFERRTHRHALHLDPGRTPAPEPVRRSDAGE
jgi:hypothetical protein